MKYAELLKEYNEIVDSELKFERTFASGKSKIKSYDDLNAIRCFFHNRRNELILQMDLRLREYPDELFDVDE